MKLFLLPFLLLTAAAGIEATTNQTTTDCINESENPKCADYEYSETREDIDNLCQRMSFMPGCSIDNPNPKTILS